MSDISIFFFTLVLYFRALFQGFQPHMSSNIENWWGVGDRWRHNAGHMTSFFEKTTREKYVVLIVTFDLIGLLPTNHIIVNDIWNKLLILLQGNKLLILQWHTGVCEEPFNVNRKIAQTTQNIWNCIIRGSNLQELANFGDYPGDFSNLETRRNRLKSGVFRIIQESWQR